MTYKRILITGGTGFIGNNLARYFNNDGHDVTIMARSLDKLPIVPDGIRFIENDISRGEFDVANYDLIYHCASTVNDYNLLYGSNIDITTNMIGTHNLLESIRKQNPWTRLVFVSTFFVYGDMEENPITEFSPCKPKGTYGITKKAAEDMCFVYHRVFNLDVVVVRMTNIYGENQPTANQKTAAFNWMIKSCVDNKTISLYDNGKNFRDYLHISDALRGLDKVAEKGRTGETYLLGLGSSYTYKRMIDLMIKHAGGGKIRVVHSPGFHQRMGIGDFCINNEYTQSELDWFPMIDIEDGIKKTVDFYEETSNA